MNTKQTFPFALILSLVPAFGSPADKGTIPGLRSISSSYADSRVQNAVRYTVTDLGTLGGASSEANAVNNRGQVAGWFHSFDEEGSLEIWKKSKYRQLDAPQGYVYPFAYGINNRGQIVGGYQTSRLGNVSGDNPVVGVVTLWQSGKAIDLNKCLPANSGWKLERANGINDRGQIVGVGIHAGKRHAYLLTPTGGNPHRPL